MNRLFLMIGVAIAIVALLFLGQGIKKASPSDEDLRKEQADAQKAQTPPPPPAPAAKPVAPGKQATPTLSAEEVVGNPATARHHILVGWVYDENNQAKPQTLTVPLEAIRDFVQRSKGIASAEIVNLDVPAEDRTPAARTVTDLGIVEDGRAVVTDNLSDEPANSQQTAKLLANAIK